MKQAKRAILLVVALLGATSLCSVEAQTLKTTRLPDGTGTIGTAPGWTVEGAYRGSVTLKGPQGAVMQLGVPWAITLPIDPVTGWQSIAAGQAPTANVGDVVTALQQVMYFHSGQARIVRLNRRAARPAIVGVPASMFSYDFVTGGKTYTGIGYYTTLSYGQSSPVWNLYASVVAAPKATFWKQFPTMVKMWGNWKANGKTPDAGSASALTDGIIKMKWASADKQAKYFREDILGDPR